MNLRTSAASLLAAAFITASTASAPLAQPAISRRPSTPEQRQMRQWQREGWEGAFNPADCKDKTPSRDNLCGYYYGALRDGPLFIADPIEDIKTAEMYVGIGIGLRTSSHSAPPAVKPTGFYGDHPPRQCETFVVKQQPLDPAEDLDMPYMTRVFFDISHRVEDEGYVLGHPNYYTTEEFGSKVRGNEFESAVPRGEEVFVGCHRNGTKAHFEASTVSGQAETITIRYSEAFKDMMFWLKKNAATLKPKLER